MRSAQVDQNGFLLMFFNLDCWSWVSAVTIQTEFLLQLDFRSELHDFGRERDLHVPTCPSLCPFLELHG